MSTKPIGLLPANIPLVNQSGVMAPEWYLFFQFLFLRVGGSVSQNNNELIGGQFDDSGIEEIKLDVYSLRDQASAAFLLAQQAIEDIDTLPVPQANNFYDPANAVITGGSVAGVAITGSTVDSSAIGSTTASTGKFTDITNGNVAALIKTSVAMNNGAAGFAGTLLNAPVAGNPTKWIPVNDNGTIRYSPHW